MDGIAASMRCVLLMAPVFLSNGTLKSTRINTRCPFRTISFRPSLLLRDIVSLVTVFTDACSVLIVSEDAGVVVSAVVVAGVLAFAVDHGSLETDLRVLSLLTSL